MFKGREIQHADLGQKVLEKYVTDIAEFGDPITQIQRQNRFLSIILNPKRKVKS